MKLLVIALALFLVQQTFAKHDYAKSQKNHATKVNSYGKRSHHNHNYGIQQRGLPFEKCWTTCDSTVVGPRGDKILFYYRKELIAFVKETAYIALILDLKQNRGALLDGLSGGGIVFSITEEEGFSVKTGLWFEKKESFNDYFICLENLNKLWTYAQEHGRSFSVKNISQKNLVRIHKFLIVLSGKVAIATKFNISRVFKILIHNSNKLVVTWSGSLKWILESSGTIEGYVFHGGLEVFVTRTEGLRQFFTHVKGGHKVLLDANIKLDLKRILLSKTGIEVLGILVETISDRVDLSVILGDNLSSKSRFTRLNVLLGGGLHVGVDGFLNVFQKVLAILEKTHPSLHKLVESLLRFTWKSGVDVEIISKAVDIEVDVSKKQIAKYNNGEQLENITEIVYGHKNKKIIVAGINLYLFTELLTTSSKLNGLKVSIQALKIIKTRVSLAKSVPTLLLEILSFLKTTVEAEILAKLIPTLKLEYNSKGEIAIVESIKKKLEIHLLLPVLGNLYELLLRIPVIGDIVKFLDRILIEENIVSLRVLLKSSHARSAIIGIVNWLKVSLNVNVDIKALGIDNEEVNISPEPGTTSSPLSLSTSSGEVSTWTSRWSSRWTSSWTEKIIIDGGSGGSGGSGGNVGSGGNAGIGGIGGSGGSGSNSGSGGSGGNVGSGGNSGIGGAGGSGGSGSNSGSGGSGGNVGSGGNSGIGGAGGSGGSGSNSGSGGSGGNVGSGGNSGTGGAGGSGGSGSNSGSGGHGGSVGSGGNSGIGGAGGSGGVGGSWGFIRPEVSLYSPKKGSHTRKILKNAYYKNVKVHAKEH